MSSLDEVLAENERYLRIKWLEEEKETAYREYVDKVERINGEIAELKNAMSNETFLGALPPCLSQPKAKIAEEPTVGSSPASENWGNGHGSVDGEDKSTEYVKDEWE